MKKLLKGNTVRRIAAAALALSMCTVGVPLQPFSDVFGNIAVNAYAANGTTEWDSGTRIDHDTVIDGNVIIVPSSDRVEITGGSVVVINGVLSLSDAYGNPAV